MHRFNRFKLVSKTKKNCELKSAAEESLDAKRNFKKGEIYN